MKYIVYFIFTLTIFCLCLPIWIITCDWDGETNGWDSLEDGLSDMFGID